MGRTTFNRQITNHSRKAAGRVAVTFALAAIVSASPLSVSMDVGLTPHAAHATENMMLKHIAGDKKRYGKKPGSKKGGKRGMREVNLSNMNRNDNKNYNKNANTNTNKNANNNTNKNSNRNSNKNSNRNTNTLANTNTLSNSNRVSNTNSVKNSIDLNNEINIFNGAQAGAASGAIARGSIRQRRLVGTSHLSGGRLEGGGTRRGGGFRNSGSIVLSINNNAFNTTSGLQQVAGSGGTTGKITDCAYGTYCTIHLGGPKVITFNDLGDISDGVLLDDEPSEDDLRYAK